LESELYDAVGRVAVEATAVEYALSLTVEALLHSESGQVIASGQSFDALSRMAAEIVRYGYPALSSSLVEDVTKWLADAKAAYEKRNQVVHGSWSVHTDDSDAPGWSLRHRRWGRTTSAWMSRQELLGLAQELQDLLDRIQAIGPRIRAEREPEQARRLLQHGLAPRARVSRERHIPDALP
jgi:hypothetical protein